MGGHGHGYLAFRCQGLASGIFPFLTGLLVKSTLLMGNPARPTYLSLRTMVVMEMLHWAAPLPWKWAHLSPKVTDASVSYCNFTSTFTT